MPNTNFVADALQGAGRGRRLIGRRLDHGPGGLHVLPSADNGFTDLRARGIQCCLGRANIRAGLADPTADEASGEQSPAPLEADGDAVGPIAGEELVAGRAGRGGQRHGRQTVGLRIPDTSVRRARRRFSGQKRWAGLSGGCNRVFKGRRRGGNVGERFECVRLHSDNSGKVSASSGDVAVGASQVGLGAGEPGPGLI